MKTPPFRHIERDGMISLTRASSRNAERTWVSATDARFNCHPARIDAMISLKPLSPWGLFGGLLLAVVLQRAWRLAHGLWCREQGAPQPVVLGPTYTSGRQWLSQTSSVQSSSLRGLSASMSLRSTTRFEFAYFRTKHPGDVSHSMEYSTRFHREQSSVAN